MSPAFEKLRFFPANIDDVMLAFLEPVERGRYDFSSLRSGKSPPFVVTRIELTRRQTRWQSTADKRRILLCSIRYSLWAQSAPLVRGSSRRIMTLRFRAAHIRDGMRRP